MDLRRLGHEVVQPTVEDRHGAIEMDEVVEVKDAKKCLDIPNQEAHTGHMNTEAFAPYRKATAAYRKASKAARFSSDSALKAAEEAAYEAMLVAEAKVY